MIKIYLNVAWTIWLHGTKPGTTRYAIILWCLTLFRTLTTSIMMSFQMNVCEMKGIRKLH